MTPHGVSVVVPAFRSAGTLVELHDRLRRALDHEPALEFVIVDDACPDGSGDVATTLGKTDPRVRVVRHTSNLGQHRSVLSGMCVAQGEWIVVIDADLQDPPEAVPLLLERGRGTRADVVFATRQGRYQGLGRTVTGRVYRRALARLLDLPPGAAMFFAVEARLARELTALRGPEPAVVAMLASLHPRIETLPTRRARRPSGTSAYAPAARARSAWRAFRWALWIRRHDPRSEAT